MAHIEGRCEIPKERMTHHVAHWRLIPYFARFDRANYPRFWWRIKYGLLALWYLLRRNTPLRV